MESDFTHSNRAYPMRRILSAIGLLVTICVARPVEAQFHFARRDTLPERVVQRVLDAYNHHDVAAIEAEYDTVYVHENMAEMTGPHPVLRMAMRDSLILALQGIKDARMKLSRRTVAGPVVADLYVVTANGRKRKLLDIYEVRHGKIVREWEY